MNLVREATKKKEDKPPPEPTLVPKCGQCGSYKIEIPYWVYFPTQEVVEEYEDNQFYCRQCRQTYHADDYLEWGD